MLTFDTGEAAHLGCEAGSQGGRGKGWGVGARNQFVCCGMTQQHSSTTSSSGSRGGTMWL